MDKAGASENVSFSRTKLLKPKENPYGIYVILPSSRTDQYDTYVIIKRLVDNSELEE